MNEGQAHLEAQAIKDKKSLHLLAFILANFIVFLSIYTENRLSEMERKLDKILFNSRAINSNMQVAFDSCIYRKGDYVCEFNTKLPSKN